MNQSGNVVLIIIAGIAAIMVIPWIVLTVFPPAKLLFQILMAFIIFSTVRGYVGEGAISWIISGVLIYFLVFKYAEITATLWVFQLLLMVQFFSVVIWGIGMSARR